MIDWNENKTNRLLELVNSQDRNSEYRIADMLTNEFGELFSRDAVHNKIRRMGVERDVPFKQPKILIFDIETAPNTVYTWGLFNQNIGLSQVVSTQFMLCWSAKWLFDDKVMSDCISPTDVICGNDESIVKSLWNVIDEADIIVAHNGRSFDRPWANSRFLYYGLVPPSPYRLIDTYKSIRSSFRFMSNKLAWLSSYLLGDNKLKTDFDLWSGCLKGDQVALDKMLEYNKHDTELLEELYVMVRPWIKSHPNVGLYYESNEALCSHCGSPNLETMTKVYTTNTSVYQTFRCKACNAVVRLRKSVGSIPTTPLAR